ncbi:hypothetical protein GLOTRDRAFT_133668 [Gloeophyllum trabeum ATCC 11539]|uniref:Membrane-associated proteins in eicosanoid and glutathione metabolism n=1 Tax=Gloeophyllum trabeum (strain ATCC 11539 / FP-39264 / Madison 617) TaxID=670483 RepID=S7R9I2_GLOTA|nr:uncharacterized protein GLOTRDRAFT_133668 [Gloeophyllum trabeum ATCC 11539]EPQ50930.1 hypothetical protein GLOTRDRAFT_133668 [Gloeophyllum trabeum ATCC 11539]
MAKATPSPLFFPTTTNDACDAHHAVVDLLDPCRVANDVLPNDDEGLINKTMGYNGMQPRSNTQKMMSDNGVSPEVAKRAARMEGAHLNGNEILPLWIGAVVLSNHARLPEKMINIAAMTFIALRVAYNHVYINGTTPTLAKMRTALWFSSVAVPMTLMIQAANKVRKLGALPLF